MILFERLWLCLRVVVVRSLHYFSHFSGLLFSSCTSGIMVHPTQVMPAFQGFISQPQLGGFGQPQFGGFGQPTYGQVRQGASEDPRERREHI